MGAAEADQLPQDRPPGEGEDRRADEEGEEGRAGLRGVPDTPVKRPGGAVDPRGEDVDVPVQPAGAQGVELPLAEIPAPEDKEEVPRDDGEANAALERRAGHLVPRLANILAF